AWTVEQSAIRLGGDGRTDGYASPEQCRRAAFIDYRSDMFSASAVTYAMITGELPYDKLGGNAGLDRFCAGAEPKLAPPSSKSWNETSFPREHWKHFDEILRCGLQLDADKRFPTTATWIEQLNQADAQMKLAKPMSVLARAALSMIEWFSGPA
ncbi:MAG: hypothetical protein L0Z53_22220, partial [Acidobacteriales bacterium]|nr:hypothetical protein [Terriglobales bacterium]